MARYDRKNQLAQLESVIESKKREIQEKLEAQKRKETEEALKKIQTQPAVPPRRPFWKRNDQKVRRLGIESPTVEQVSNVFTNDGSFLDKFKKLSKNGLKPDKVDVETLAKAREAEEEEKERKRRLDEERAQKELERRAWEREREFRKIERDQERELRNSRPRESQWQHASLSIDERSPRTSLGSGIKLNLPPPGMVQIIPQVQLVTPVVIQQQQPQQMMMNPPPQVPQFTTNEIQMQANSGFTGPLHLPEISLPDTSQPPPTAAVHSLHPPPSFPPPQQIPPLMPPAAPASLRSHALPPPPVSSIPIPPPLHLTSQVIHPPSPINVSSIPPPPSTPPINPDLIFQPQKLSGIPFFETNPAHGSDNAIPLPKRVSPVDLPSAKGCGEVALNSGVRHLALMVAEAGDQAEHVLRSRNEDDTSLRFLFEPESLMYKQFRRLVEDYRSGKVVEFDSEPEEIIPSDSESDEDDRRSSSVGEKYDPLAISDDSDEEPMIAKDENSSNDTVEKKEFDDDKSAIDTALKKESYHERSYEFTEDNYDEVPRKIKREEGCESRPSFSGAGDFTGKKPLAFVSAGSSTLTSSGIENKDKKSELKRKRSRWGEKADEPALSSSLGIPLPPDLTGIPPIGVVAPSHLSIQLPPNVHNIPPPRMASATALGIHLPQSVAPLSAGPPGQIMLSQVTRRDPGLVAYARQTFGSTELSDEDWKRAEDHYKINLLYQDMMNKKAELEKLARKGQFKYEYDSDEEVEGGTWEHKLRQTEMAATEAWATELTRQAQGKHHIGDFLPPDELKRFMEKYNAVKEGREPDLSDYKEFKLREDNVGYQLLQKMGWSEGQGLGQDGQGIVDPVNKASNRLENQGLGIDRSDGLYAEDDEYTAYRKRMMLAYRFRPNPLNNPRRPYY